MEPKLILGRAKSPTKISMMARLDIETHETLKNLSAETGIPIIELINKCVSFAIKYAVVEK